MIDRINHFAVACRWYVWGRQDAGDYRADAEGFADAYIALVKALYAGESTYLPTVQDAYNRFVGNAVA